MMDRLRISQIAFHGHCGVTEAEREVGQRLSVDLELACDFTAAARSDRLADTIDYHHLAEAVADLGRATRVALLETLATRIAECVLEDRRVASVRVRLTKPPPCEVIRGGVTVEITRTASHERSYGA